MRRLRKQRRLPQRDSIDQINVTPLLDLTFLLLIVFMITMPLMEYGTTVKPPKMNGSELPPDNFKVISLTKTGTILFNEEALTREELTAKLQHLKQQTPDTQLLLRGDGEQFYREVINLMTLIRRAGFENVTLVTSAEDK